MDINMNKNIGNVHILQFMENVTVGLSEFLAAISAWC